MIKKGTRFSFCLRLKLAINFTENLSLKLGQTFCDYGREVLSDKVGWQILASNHRLSPLCGLDSQK